MRSLGSKRCRRLPFRPETSNKCRLPSQLSYTVILLLTIVLKRCRYCSNRLLPAANGRSRFLKPGRTSKTMRNRIVRRGRIKYVDTSGPRRGGPDASVAGRSGRALADRAFDTLREQCPGPYRGRPRQNRRLYRQMGLDDAGAGRREGRVNRWPFAHQRGGKTGVEVCSGGGRAGLE